MTSSPPPSLAFPKGGDCLIYEVELTLNYGTGNTVGKDWTLAQGGEKDPLNKEAQQDTELGKANLLQYAIPFLVQSLRSRVEVLSSAPPPPPSRKARLLTS